MAKGQRRAAYHHGELRQACVAQGLVLLAQKGKEAVSLRAVARRCRVSPRAPYQHFADKTEFLAALAEEGFKAFGAALTQARGGLLGLAKAYLRFGAEQPALMQLMFGEDFRNRAERNPALDRAARATFEQLEREVARLQPRETSEAHRLNAVSAWALVHGLSELLRHGQLEHVLPKRADVDAVLPAAVRLFGAFTGQASISPAATRRRPA